MGRLLPPSMQEVRFLISVSGASSGRRMRSAAGCLGVTGRDPMKFVYLASATALCLVAAPAIANDYPWTPEKPITIIVPWGAGGATDQVTRVTAGVLEEELGRRVGLDRQEERLGSAARRLHLGRRSAETAGNVQASRSVRHLGRGLAALQYGHQRATGLGQSRHLLSDDDRLRGGNGSRGYRHHDGRRRFVRPRGRRSVEGRRRRRL